MASTSHELPKFIYRLQDTEPTEYRMTFNHNPFSVNAGKIKWWLSSVTALLDVDWLHVILRWHTPQRQAPIISISSVIQIINTILLEQNRSVEISIEDLKFWITQSGYPITQLLYYYFEPGWVPHLKISNRAGYSTFRYSLSSICCHQPI